MKSLLLTPELAEDKSRKEVLRVWIDDGKISVSLIDQFPSGQKEPLAVWAVVLSDIFHHVADALALQTKLDGTFVRNQIKLYYKEPFKSGRLTQFGNVRVNKRSSKELELPELSGSNCAEIIRVVFAGGSIYALVRVGGWLPDEESVWGNILYDLIQIISQNISPAASEYVVEDLSQRTLKLMDEPGTQFSGTFY